MRQITFVFSLALVFGARQLAAQASQLPHTRLGGPRDSAGAVARCNDGTYAHVFNPLAACATHRGIARWLGIRDRTPRDTTPAPSKKKPD
jgi:hypothetical protein